MIDKSKNKRVTKPFANRSGCRGVRKSKTDVELWRRRIEIYRLWSTGVSRSEIASKYFISTVTVSEDLKVLQQLENPLDAKNKIDAGYKEIIRRAFDRAETTKPEYQAALLRVAIEALAHLAKLHGFERDVNQYNFSQTQILNTSGINPYDKLSESDLEKEFLRRRAIGKDPAK